MSTLREKLTTQILKIPGVSEKIWEQRSDGFSSLAINGKEFAHFHNDNEIDLRLTLKIIKQNNLKQALNSEKHPNRSSNSPWIELTFHDQNDIKTICSLVNQLLID